MRLILYSVEVLIGYGPVITFWLIGIGMGLPYSIASMAEGEPVGFLLFSSLLLGSVGMWGIIQLLKKLIWRDINYPIQKYRIHLLVGCISLVIASIGFIGVNYLIPIYFVVPILVTWHLYYVCKNS
ncbi:hypothetical protein [Microbulbifer sp. PSTR4-B]|uniref:hypothetical protein n=1 Tax=Microbulbifer sp. PSTR4-B TaxID=3243396 RepID=UPI0040391133